MFVYLLIMKKFLLILLVPVFVFSNYEYSAEDHNPTSPTYRSNVWLPGYADHISLHYFSTQGWAGWTNTFWQLSDYQDELKNNYGYENVVIIAVGKSNIDNFNSNFCLNSDLPLVMDEAFDFPIRAQFSPYSDHKELAILGYDGEFLGSIQLNSGLNAFAKNYILGIIEDNYVTSILGDINGDNILNISDLIIIVDFILSEIYDENADMNSDGGLNIQDITILLNIIL